MTHSARMARCRDGSSHVNTLIPRSSFFELALPVIAAQGADEEPYPPADGQVTLTSSGGYKRGFDISEGVCTDDQFCSFRFYDISSRQAEESFTAKLTWGAREQVLFKDQKIARLILVAGGEGKHEPAFSGAPTPEPTQAADGEAKDAGDGADEGKMDPGTLMLEARGKFR